MKPISCLSLEFSPSLRYTESETSLLIPLSFTLAISYRISLKLRLILALTTPNPIFRSCFSTHDISSNLFAPPLSYYSSSKIPLSLCTEGSGFLSALRQIGNPSQLFQSLTLSHVISLVR